MKIAHFLVALLLLPLMPLSAALPAVGKTTKPKDLPIRRCVPEDVTPRPFAAVQGQDDLEGNTFPLNPDNLPVYRIRGARLRAGFVPEASSFVVGEPLFINFIVRNEGPGDFSFRFGGDVRGSVRRNTFTVIARCEPAEGALEHDPVGYNHGGGQLHLITLKAGEEFTTSLLLQHWISTSPTGEHVVRPPDFPDEKAEPCLAALSVMCMFPIRRDVPVSNAFPLRLLEGGDAALDKVVKRLHERAQSPDPRERRKAWFALGYINRPAALEALLKDLPGVFRKPAEGVDENERLIRATDPEVFVSAIANYIEDPRILPALADALENPASLGRGDAFEVVSRCDHPRVSKAMRELLREDPRRWSEAARVLGRLHDTDALPQMRQLIKTVPPGEIARCDIAQGLCELGEKFDPEWVMTLIRGWPGGNQTNGVSTAAGVIGKHGTPADARELARLLRDDAPDAVSSYNQALINAIIALGGPKHPYAWMSHAPPPSPERVKRNRDAIDAYRAWAQ